MLRGCAVRPPLPAFISKRREVTSLLNACFTPRDIAERLGVSSATVINWIKQGKIDGFKVGHRWRVSQEAYKSFVTGCKGASTGKKYDSIVDMLYTAAKEAQRRLSNE